MEIIAIMQPLFHTRAGYWQLIRAAGHFVVFGYANRRLIRQGRGVFRSIRGNASFGA
jgi:hypothetical protein